MARRRRSDLFAGDAVDAAHPSQRQRKRRRWRLLLFGGVGLAALVVATAPAVLSTTAGRDWLLRRTLPPTVGTLSAQSLQLRWWGPQRLAGVELRDAEGQLLAAAEQLELTRPLWSLAADSRTLGKLQILRPAIQLRLRDQGSDWEDFVAAWQAAEAVDPPPDAAAQDGVPPWHGELVVREGTLRVAGPDEPSAWTASGVELNLRRGPSDPLWSGEGQANLSASAFGAAAPTSGLVKLGVTPVDNQGVQVTLVGDRLPLAPAGPWLARALPAARIDGATSLDLKLQGAVSAAAGPWEVTGNVQLFAASLACAALQGDTLRLDAAEATVAGTWADSVWDAADCRLRTNWGAGRLQGRWDVARWLRDPRSLLTGEALPQDDAACELRCDLAQVARMLPHALRLREGVQIDAGAAEIALTSAPSGGRRRWTTAVRIANLLGSDGARQIRWEQPLEAQLEWTGDAGAALLERAHLRAPAVDATLALAGDAYEGSFHADLAALSQQIGQLVDLRPWELGGIGQGTFAYRETAPEQFAARATFELTRIRVQRGDRLLWDDPQLVGSLAAAGRRVKWRPQRLDEAVVKLHGPDQSFDAELLEPAALDGRGTWHVQVAARTPLAAWRQRLGPWLEQPPEQLAGAAQLTGRVRVDPQIVQIIQCEGAVDNLRLVRGSLLVDEPRVEFRGDASWVRDSGALLANEVQFTSTTLAAAVRQVEYRPGAGSSAVLRGDAALRADLERLAGWLGRPAHPADPWPRGAATGQIALASDAQRVTARTEFDVQNFAWVRRPLLASPQAPLETTWSEPQLRFRAEAAYDRAADRLDITQCQASSALAELEGRLAVDQWSSQRALRAETSVQFNAEACERLLAQVFGGRVELRGLERAQVAVVGHPAPASVTLASAAAVAEPARHWSQRWQVEASTAFSAARLYGLPLGGAKLVVGTGQGQVRFQPLELATGGGTLVLHPLVTLDPLPAQLQLAPGDALQQVEITPEVSQAMLKFAAPILAGTTQSRGKFSLELERCTVPLGQFSAADASGKLRIHDLAVTPGPLVQTIAAQLRQIEQIAARAGGGAPTSGAVALTAVDQVVELRVAQGRVHHRGLEFRIDDVPIRSQGSVGFDESLAIVLQIPIQEKWVRGQRALQPLAGQMFELPILGTFDRPRVDEQALARVTQRLAETAAQQFIGDEINRALDRLLRPR